MPEPLLQTDQDIIHDFRNGQEHAGEKLYSRYFRRTVKFCSHYLRSEDDGEDAAQEVFLKVIVKKKILGLRDEAHLWAWIKRIAINECNRKYRMNNCCCSFPATEYNDTVKAEHSLSATIPNPEEQLVHEEQRAQLQLALQALPSIYYASVLVTYLENRSYKEAARLLKIKVRMLGVYLFRAKKRLLQIIKSKDESLRKIKYAS